MLRPGTWHHIALVRIGGISYTYFDGLLIAAVTPSGQRWNSYLEQMGIGKNGVTYLAARAAFALLSEMEQGAWETAAGALTPKVLEVPQKDAGGMAGTAVKAGEVFFIYVYALSMMGITDTPTATPPTYA